MKRNCNRVTSEEVERRLFLGRHFLRIRESYRNNATEWYAYLKSLQISSYLAESCMRMAAQFHDPVRRAKMLALNLPATTIDALSKYYVSDTAVDDFLERAKPDGSTDEYTFLISQLMEEHPIPRNTECLIEDVLQVDAPPKLQQIASDLQKLAIELHTLVNSSD